MTQARVAIVIVTYNSGAEIGACLDAVSSLPGVEILVVDNASSDGTRAEVEQRSVRLIPNRSNAGFAAAVNQGVRATSAPLVLLLNPDTHVVRDPDTHVVRDPDTHVVRGIDALAGRFADARMGAAGGLLISRDGTPQIGFFARNLPTPAALIFEVLGINRLWPRNPVNWHYRCLNLDPMRAQAVEQPAGAFLMFRREAWERIGGFDERFWPIWFEDVDFCARLRMDKWSVCYEPKAVAVHRGAHSIRELPVEKLQHYWYCSLLGYAGKYYNPVVFRIVCLAVAAGAIGRSLAGVRRGGLRNIAIYAGVWGFAWKRFFTPHPDDEVIAVRCKT